MTDEADNDEQDDMLEPCDCASCKAFDEGRIIVAEVDPKAYWTTREAIRDGITLHPEMGEVNLQKWFDHIPTDIQSDIAIILDEVCGAFIGTMITRERVDAMASAIYVAVRDYVDSDAAYRPASEQN